MTGDPLAVMETFHRLLGESGLEGLLDQGVGHRVVMPVDRDVVIDIHPHLFPGGVDVRRCRQRAHGGAVDGREGLPARPRQLLEGTLVEPFA